MAGITLSDISNILEKIIRPAVEDQLYAGTILWNMFGGYDSNAKTKESMMPKLNMGVLKTSMDNQTFYIPIMTAHSSGAVAIAEGGTLNPGKPVTNQANVAAKYQTATFRIDKQTLAVKDAGVAVRQLDFFMKQNALAMVIDLNRQCYGAGNAVIGTVNTSGTSSTDVVFTPSPNGDIDYTRYTPPGTHLIIGGNTSVTVTSIVAKNEITISVAQSFNAGDNIYKADGGADGSAVIASELDGLNESISLTGNYQGLPASNVWQAGYVDSDTEALSLPDMNAAFVQGNRNGNIKYVVMNATEFAAYGALLTGNIRFSYEEVLGGGWKGLDFMGGNAKVVLDYDCPDDHVYFISPDSWSLGEMNPFEYEKGTDGVLTRITGSLNYEAVGTWFGNLLNFRRSANALLSGRVG